MSEADLLSWAQSDACVLLTGTPRTTLALARQIHNLSARCHGPFAAVDCRVDENTLPDLIHGTMTPAELRMADDRRRPLGHGGTLVLKEVGQLTPPAQVRLAKALVALAATRKAGSPRWRVIATTEEPLFYRVVDGTFDDHLYYRLNAIHLVLAAPGSPSEMLEHGHS